MERKTKIENCSAQQDSKFSNGRLSGVFCWPQGQDKNSPAQWHSKMTKCWMGIMGIMGIMGVMRRMGWKTKIESSPTQQDSGIYKSKMCPMRLIGHIGLMGKENQPVKPHSKFSNGRLSGVFCWPQGQDENSPAQRHSKMSKRGNSPLSPLCLFSPLAPKSKPAQPHSKFSKLVLSSQYISSLWRSLKYRWQNIVCSCLRRLQSGIFSNIFSSL
jgi:hypothetical protein